MIPSDSLPPEWQCLSGVVQYVKRTSAYEWSCDCPFCRDSIPHDWNSGPPDRGMLRTDGKIRFWCRACGRVAFPDMFGDERWERPSREEQQRDLEEWRRRAEAKKHSAERELEHISAIKKWLQYSDMKDEAAREWWRKRGIPYGHQEFWSLGWDFDMNRWGYPSATIPLFDQQGNILNIKHRLQVPKAEESKVGKYRYNVPGLPQPMFLCNPELPLDNHVIAVEGEVKSMVVWATLDDPAACIVGLPGLNPAPHITDTLAKVDAVTLVLDPGADERGPDGWSKMGKLVQAIGRQKTSVLVPPLKVDDGILMAHLDKRDVRVMIESAVAA